MSDFYSKIQNGNRKKRRKKIKTRNQRRRNKKKTRKKKETPIENDFEPQHEISNNVVCATRKGSDQPAHARSLIRAFAVRLNSL